MFIDGGVKAAVIGVFQFWHPFCHPIENLSLHQKKAGPNALNFCLGIIRLPIVDRIDHVIDWQAFLWVATSNHVYIFLKEHQDVLRIKAYIGIEEHQMGRTSVVHCSCYQSISPPRDQTFIHQSIQTPLQAPLRCSGNEPNKAGEGDFRYLTSVTGNQEVDMHAVSANMC